jgi:hypothetical protein
MTTTVPEQREQIKKDPLNGKGGAAGQGRRSGGWRGPPRPPRTGRASRARD